MTLFPFQNLISTVFFFDRKTEKGEMAMDLLPAQVTVSSLFLLQIVKWVQRREHIYITFSMCCSRGNQSLESFSQNTGLIQAAKERAYLCPSHSFFFSLVLGIEPRDLHTLGKCFTTKSHPSLFKNSFLLSSLG